MRASNMADFREVRQSPRIVFNYEKQRTTCADGDGKLIHDHSIAKLNNNGLEEAGGQTWPTEEVALAVIQALLSGRGRQLFEGLECNSGILNQWLDLYVESSLDSFVWLAILPRKARMMSLSKQQSINASPVTVSCSLPSSCDVQPHYMYESMVHSQTLLNTLNQQRKAGLLCDITIIVEGFELQAHKAVLAACSSYFNGIITDPTNVSHNIVLELSSISKIGMDSLLEFVYTSKVAVTKDNVDHILSASRELEIKSLEASCLDVLKQKLVQDGTSLKTTATFYSKDNNNTQTQVVQSIIKPDESLPKASNKCCLDSSAIKCHANLQNPAPIMGTGNCNLMRQLQLNLNTPLVFNKSQSVSQAQNILKISENSKSSQKLEKRTFLPKILPLPPQGSHTPIMKVVCPITSLSTEGTTSIQPLSVSCSNKANQSNCMISSTCNSDTDDANSTDEENDQGIYCAVSEYGPITYKPRKSADVILPFSMEDLTYLPRCKLHALMNRNPHLSTEQRRAINEIRRKSKNRLAAQKCRQRKMNCIRGLQCELEDLHKKHNELMKERRMLCENASELSNMFQMRVEKVFNTSEEPNDLQRSKDCDKIADYFRDASEQIKKMVEESSKLRCTDLSPINWPSAGVNSDIVVICDEPCSPGSICSTTSSQSDFTKNDLIECTIVQDGACKKPLYTPITASENEATSASTFNSGVL